MNLVVDLFGAVRRNPHSPSNQQSLAVMSDADKALGPRERRRVITGENIDIPSNR